MTKGAKMGKIIDKLGNAAVKVKKTVKENGPNIIRTVGAFAVSYLTGYGIASLVVDASGMRKATYESVHRQGVMKGYGAGYENGLQAAAQLRGIEQGTIEPNIINPFKG